MISIANKELEISKKDHGMGNAACANELIYEDDENTVNIVSWFLFFLLSHHLTYFRSYDEFCTGHNISIFLSLYFLLVFGFYVYLIVCFLISLMIYVTALHVKGFASNISVLGITEVQEMLIASGACIPRTVHELITHLACRLARWDDRLFRKYIFGAADEVELIFMNNYFNLSFFLIFGLLFLSHSLKYA